MWGYNGYCRLGLGNQVDALKPKVVPQFAGPNDAQMGAKVIAGPTNSVVIDKQGMYWMAGKVRALSVPTRFHALTDWRAVEEQWRGYVSVSCLHFSWLPIWRLLGSAGSPYSTFRFMQDIMCVVRPSKRLNLIGTQGMQNQPSKMWRCDALGGYT